jgi:DNA-binding NarL/FixJ family response regulator
MGAFRVGIGGMSTPRILVVEDHALLRDRIAEMLIESGADVVGTAPDGNQGIVAAIELAPDIVLLDLSLPDRSGLDVLKTLRQKATHARVIILTAYEDAELERVCLAAGAAAFVGKSRLRDELAGVLRTVSATSPDDAAPAASNPSGNR